MFLGIGALESERRLALTIRRLKSVIPSVSAPLFEEKLEKQFDRSSRSRISSVSSEFRSSFGYKFAKH